MLKKTLLLLLCSALLLTGCSQDSPSENSTPGSQADSGQADHSNDPSEDAVDDNSDDTAGNAPSGTDDTTDEISENDTRKPETVSLVMNKTNGNEKVSVTLIGLKQYDKLENDSYTDTPEEDNVYLVMFLQVSNHDNGDDYINPENLSATVDGNEIQNCALFNPPESYEPIFNHISNGEERMGFIAWQVPSDWQKLEMEYDGWQDTCNLIVTADVSPDMLCDPPELK